MAEMTDAQRRRIDSVMLESLSISFQMKADGFQFMHSFNDADVAEMLERAAEIVKPGPTITTTSPKGARDE